MKLSTYLGIVWLDVRYRCLWYTSLIFSFAGQISGLALSLIAANQLHATPTQLASIGLVGGIPFVFFMLPAGVWLDRVAKLPAYIMAELLMLAVLASVPLAWFYDCLSIALLRAVAFASSAVSVVSGTAGQVLMTQIVCQEHLLEAHAKNRVAGSFAEITGPGLAGLLIKLLGAPLALLANCLLLLWGVVTLSRLQLVEPQATPRSGQFWPQLKDGMQFVFQDPLLLPMALTVGCWQVLQTCAMVTQVLFVTRDLGMSEVEYGVCLTGSGFGTVLAGTFAHRLGARIGPGPSLITGFSISGLGWLLLAAAPAGLPGRVLFVLMLLCFSCSVVLIFSNMLAMRQAITPPAMLSRMTSTMRWLTLFPALPGTYLGGVLAEHFGLRFPLYVGGIGAIFLALWAFRFSPLRRIKTLGRVAA